MPNIGLPELIVIGMILVLVFGASRLPQLGAGMGRAVRSIKRAFDNDPRIDVQASPPAEPVPPQTQDRPDSESVELSAKRQLAGEITDAEIVAPAQKSDAPKTS